MRQTIFIILIYSSLSSWGQNPEKLLTKSQLDSIAQGNTIYFKVDNSISNYFEGFQGTTKVEKINGKIYFDFIDEALLLDKDGRIKAKIRYNQLGQLKTYQEINSSGQIVYDCKYEIKIINGNTYRLEHLKVYYEPEHIWHEGSRYLKQKNDQRPIKYSRQKKYGLWTYYDINGNLESTKNKGEIK